MRVLVLVVVHVALAQVALAGTAKCYAGIERSGDAHIGTVIERDVNRDARENPHLHVARECTARSLSRRRSTSPPMIGRSPTTRAGFHGTGTLDGKPWAWTGAHHESKAFGGTVITDVHSSERRSRVRRASSRRAKRGGVAMEAKAFDCRDLGKRRAALDDSAPDAVRTCFEGTQNGLRRCEPRGRRADRRAATNRDRHRLTQARQPRRDRNNGTSITASNGHS